MAKKPKTNSKTEIKKRNSALKGAEKKIKSQIKSKYEIKKTLVLDWLCNYNNWEYPELFMLCDQKKLHNILLYQVIPSAPYLLRVYFNKHFNNVQENFKNKELLLSLKTCCQLSGVNKFDFDNTWVPYSEKEKYIGWYKDKYGENSNLADIMGLYFLMKTFNFNLNVLFDVNTEQELDELNEQIRNMREQEQLNKMESDERYLKELNQDVIDKLQLIPVDAKILENINKVLYIFVDEFNTKRFYVEDYKYEFVISSNRSEIYNDYIMNIDPNIHVGVCIKDSKLVKKLKSNLTNSFKRSKNLSIYQ